MKSADSQLQAKMAFWRSQTKYVYVVGEESGLVDYQENTPVGETVRILFQYTVNTNSQPVQEWGLAE